MEEIFCFSGKCSLLKRPISCLHPGVAGMNDNSTIMGASVNIGAIFLSPMDPLAAGYMDSIVDFVLRVK